MALPSMYDCSGTCTIVPVITTKLVEFTVRVLRFISVCTTNEEQSLHYWSSVPTSMRKTKYALFSTT